MLKTILSFSHACSSITTDDFAQKLVENHLTTWPETSDRYHMAKFMKEVIKQVELDKENFTTFLKILEEESVFCSLHNMIQREYGMYTVQPAIYKSCIAEHAPYVIIHDRPVTRTNHSKHFVSLSSVS